MAEQEQAVGARLRAIRQLEGKTLVELEAASGVSKSTISEIELTPVGEPLPPSAESYCRALGFELVRRFGYELRPRDDSARASRTASSIASNTSTRRREEARPTLSSSRATASRASTAVRSGKQRSAASNRLASRGGR